MWVSDDRTRGDNECIDDDEKEEKEDALVDDVVLVMEDEGT